MVWFPPLSWRQREGLLIRGCLLAIAPALALLPVVMFLLLTPQWPHSRLLAAFLLPLLVVLELWGLLNLVRCCAHQMFDLLTMVAVGALVVVAAIAAYSGIFLGVIAGKLY